MVPKHSDFHLYLPLSYTCRNNYQPLDVYLFINSFVETRVYNEKLESSNVNHVSMLNSKVDHTLTFPRQPCKIPPYGSGLMTLIFGCYSNDRLQCKSLLQQVRRRQGPGSI